MRSFRIGIRSEFAEWSRYDVFMTAVCFDVAGEMVAYVNLDDGKREMVTPHCDHADVYLYVIAREFPASDRIASSPPFDVEVSVRAGAEEPVVTAYRVNQWGGLSVKLRCS